jgi:preprotein translocase subunit SecE
MTQPMNRETKRMMQRQGSINADGTPVATPRSAPTAADKAERTPPAQFVREVRTEMKKVVWPTRAEVINYTTVTVVMLLLVTVAVFLLDLLSSKAVYGLFS